MVVSSCAVLICDFDDRITIVVRGQLPIVGAELLYRECGLPCCLRMVFDRYVSDIVFALLPVRIIAFIDISDPADGCCGRDHLVVILLIPLDMRFRDRFCV